MSARKTKPAFAVGDVVTLKGQSAILTVSLKPDGAMEKPDWTWVVSMLANGVTFSLVPTACLAKIVHPA